MWGETVADRYGVHQAERQECRHADKETAAKKTRCLTGRDPAVTRCWSDVEALSLSVLLIISIILVLQLPITVIKEISSKTI